MLETYEEIYTIFTRNNFDAQWQFINNCPDFRTKDTALRFIELSQPNSHLAALDAVCNGINGTENEEWGIKIAQVLMEQGANQFTSAPLENKAEALQYALNGVSFYTKFLFDRGYYDDAIASANTALTFIPTQERLQYEPLNVAQLYKIESLMALKKFDDARHAFKEVENAQFSIASIIQKDNIANKIQALFSDATKIADSDQLSESLKGSQKAANNVLEWLQNLVNQDSDNPYMKEMTGGLKKPMEDLTDKMQEEIPKSNDLQADIFNQAKNGFDAFHGVFTGQFGDIDLHNIQKRNLEAFSVLTNPLTAYDTVELEKSLSEFVALYQVVSEKKVNFDKQNLLWSMCICLNRLQRYAQGAQVAQQLWHEVENTRQNITKYTERAGLLHKYPYLFTRLCDFYEKTGNFMGMLKAIESSKGRVLADALDKYEGQNKSVSHFTDIVEQLPQKMLEHKTNYLTFLFEENYGFAVLVAENGELYGQKLPIGTAHLTHWLDENLQDPNRWQNKRGGLFGSKSTVDITEVLSPLVSWLEPLFEKGIFTEGGHLCYCPDEGLHLFPLHYVKFQGQYLIEKFTISRTQGAFTMLQSLKQASLKPHHFTGIVANIKEDDAEKVAGFEQSMDFIGKILRGGILKDEKTDLSFLKNQDMTERVVHFTTHGTFPNTEKGNPYTDSGLLIFDGPKQPSLDKDLPDLIENMLTPQRLLNEKLRFDKAHISLQACVSGRAKEGIGGDALGLEWAFLLSGANSLLSANWDVDYRYATLFCNTFYDYWLQKGCTKAQAFQQTCLDILKMDLPSQYPKPYYWASFSLTGDWR
jgi:tetratricopeptide (TPR) repeat protein